MRDEMGAASSRAASLSSQGQAVADPECKDDSDNEKSETCIKLPLSVYIAPTKGLRNEVRNIASTLFNEENTLLLGSLRGESDPLQEHIVRHIETKDADMTELIRELEQQLDEFVSDHNEPTSALTASDWQRHKMMLANHHNACFMLYCQSWGNLSQDWADGIQFIAMTKTAFIKMRAMRNGALHSIMKQRLTLLLADELQAWPVRDWYAALKHVQFGIGVGDPCQDLSIDDQQHSHRQDGFQRLQFHNHKSVLRPPIKSNFESVWSFPESSASAAHPPRLTETFRFGPTLCEGYNMLANMGSHDRSESDSCDDPDKPRDIITAHCNAPDTRCALIRVHCQTRQFQQVPDRRALPDFCHQRALPQYAALRVVAAHCAAWIVDMQSSDHAVAGQASSRNLAVLTAYALTKGWLKHHLPPMIVAQLNSGMSDRRDWIIEDVNLWVLYLTVAEAQGFTFHSAMLLIGMRNVDDAQGMGMQFKNKAFRRIGMTRPEHNFVAVLMDIQAIEQGNYVRWNELEDIWPSHDYCGQTGGQKPAKRKRGSHPPRQLPPLPEFCQRARTDLSGNDSFLLPIHESLQHNFSWLRATDGAPLVKQAGKSDDGDLPVETFLSDAGKRATCLRGIMTVFSAVQRRGRGIEESAHDDDEAQASEVGQAGARYQEYAAELEAFKHVGLQVTEDNTLIGKVDRSESFETVAANMSKQILDLRYAYFEASGTSHFIDAVHWQLKENSKRDHIMKGWRHIVSFPFCQSLANAAAEVAKTKPYMEPHFWSLLLATFQCRQMQVAIHKAQAVTTENASHYWKECRAERAAVEVMGPDPSLPGLTIMKPRTHAYHAMGTYRQYKTVFTVVMRFKMWGDVLDFARAIGFWLQDLVTINVESIACSDDQRVQEVLAGFREGKDQASMMASTITGLLVPQDQA